MSDNPFIYYNLSKYVFRKYNVPPATCESQSLFEYIVSLAGLDLFESLSAHFTSTSTENQKNERQKKRRLKIRLNFELCTMNEFIVIFVVELILCIVNMSALAI